jgi:hypothetical protein
VIIAVTSVILTQTFIIVTLSAIVMETTNFTSDLAIKSRYLLVLHLVGLLHI